jgi:hypothetical protein
LTLEIKKYFHGAKNKNKNLNTLDQSFNDQLASRKDQNTPNLKTTSFSFNGK